MARIVHNVGLADTGLPERLKSLREAQHLTKADLAEKAGLSARTVHDLETGRRDRIQEKTLMLLAQALGISADELLGRDPASARDESPPEPIPSPAGKLYLSQPTGLAILAVLIVVLTFGAGHLWTYARGNAEWTSNADRITVRDSIFGIELWSLAGDNRFSFCQASPWDSRQLLVGVGGQTFAGGLLLNLDRATGDTIWSVAPDIEAIARAFGEEDVLGSNFTCNKAQPADLDGDGEPELVAHFVHSRFYPFAICALDREGRMIAQYAHKGHIYESLVLDLDGDGRDEYIGAGTNNAKAYQGASIFILDLENWAGASVDSQCDPQSGEHDSARVRLVIPQYPGPYMNLLQATRLSAFNLLVHRDSAGTAILSAGVGVYPATHMVLYLDAQLRPKGCEPTDRFQELSLSQWPESLTVGTGPGDPVWCAQWLASHRRFEAGRELLAEK
jgi:transcriptional regulator with XRE-family HTH domain